MHPTLYFIIDFRTKQEFSTKFVKLLGRFGESYYVRFVVILLIAAPSSVSLPTLLPAGKLMTILRVEFSAEKVLEP